MLIVHGWLWFRLVRSTIRRSRLRRWLAALTVVLAVLPAVAVSSRRLPWGLRTPVEWVGYTWLGIAFYLFLVLLLLEPVRWVLRAVQRRRRPPAQPTYDRDDVSRRLFLGRFLAVTAGAVALGTAGTGVVIANSAPKVRRVRIALHGLDPALEGYRIVTFSDAHLSPEFGGRRFARVVELVNGQNPDAIAIVGDLVDGSVAELRQDVAPLKDLVSRDGAFFVTGNHEYFVDTEAWLRHLPTLGINVLHNERVALSRGGAAFDLAGIDDRTAAGSGVPGQGADLGKALRGRDTSRFVVLLAHQPVQVEQAGAAGVDLQLSGHTHGGQLWPFDYAVRLDQPAVQGLSLQGHTQLYVTPGVGYWGPPMRIGAAPEVTVIELGRA